MPSCITKSSALYPCPTGIAGPLLLPASKLLTMISIIVPQAHRQIRSQLPFLFHLVLLRRYPSRFQNLVRTRLSPVGRTTKVQIPSPSIRSHRPHPQACRRNPQTSPVGHRNLHRLRRLRKARPRMRQTSRLHHPATPRERRNPQNPRWARPRCGQRMVV